MPASTHHEKNASMIVETNKIDAVGGNNPNRQRDLSADEAAQSAGMSLPK